MDDGIPHERLMDETLASDAQLRLEALKVALAHYGSALSGGTVYDLAEQIYRWATTRTPSRIRIVAVGDATIQQPQESTPMQIHDNEQFTVTVEVDDAKGFAISGDQLTVTSADETVATVQQGADGVTYTIVGGNPGSTVVTFDAGTDANGNPVVATEAVDVVPGGVATIKLTEGAVSEQGTDAGTTQAPTGDTTDASASATDGTANPPEQPTA